jgi:hypothetical protein
MDSLNLPQSPRTPLMAVALDLFDENCWMEEYWDMASPCKYSLVGLWTYAHLPKPSV